MKSTQSEPEQGDVHRKGKAWLSIAVLSLVHGPEGLCLSLIQASTWSPSLEVAQLVATDDS